LTVTEIYDPKSNAFSPGNPMLFHRDGQTATLLKNGLVLIAGGGADPASTELYDPKSATYRPAASMIVNRTMHTATLLNDGRVLMAGGAGDSGSVSPAELYTP
jgi:hypothetical protein